MLRHSINDHRLRHASMGAGVLLRTSGVDVKHEGIAAVLVGANPYNRQPPFAAVQDNAPHSGGWLAGKSGAARRPSVGRPVERLALGMLNSMIFA